MKAKKILEMIENVSPDDGDKLDEIDARVLHYYCKGRSTGVSIKNGEWSVLFPSGLPFGLDGEIDVWIRGGFYTRSRDALKAIRPDGWFFGVSYDGGYMCTGERYKEDGWFCSPDLPTEELAESHAIIQAIEYERNQDEHK